LLISEGSHEGSRAEEKPQALQALVSRVLPGAVFDWLDVHDLPRGNPFPGRGGGHLKLAWKAMLHATRNGFDALVLVTDADGRHARITEFDEAQQSDRFLVPRALGIAVEAFDAWILADHQAMSQALVRTVQLQPLPENFTGGKGSDRHPKQVCRALLEQHGWGGTQAEFYAAVCRCAELDVLAARCPRGFQPFLQRLNRLQQDLVERPAR
jgi:hypothetical protein